VDRLPDPLDRPRAGSSFSERAKRVASCAWSRSSSATTTSSSSGPRGTGKSHLFQQISPYAHLISGGKATVAKMFVNNASGQRGLVCQYDVVCFDEVSGVSFDQKDGVNIMKGYMASGQFSRGKENIRAEGGIVMVGNFDVDVEQQQRVAHLLSPLPPEMRNDTAFMDRLHAFVPGWDFPKLNPNDHFTDHFGLVSDFLSECWSKLRSGNRVSVMQGRVHLGGALSGRDIEAVNKTVSGLTKLLFPDPSARAGRGPRVDRARRARVAAPREGAAEALLQERVPQHALQLHRRSRRRGAVRLDARAAQRRGHRERSASAGQVWAVSPSSPDAGPGLYRLEVASGPGAGVKVLNQPTPPAFRESVKVGEQNLYTRAKELVGDRNPREHEFSIQMRASTPTRPGRASASRSSSPSAARSSGATRGAEPSSSAR
jgi:ATP-dependent Lon protease